MNFANFKTVKNYTKLRKIILAALILFAVLHAKALEVDFSRRQVEFQKIEDQNRLPASAPSAPLSPLAQVLDATDVAQDIVIMNTEAGFIPQTLRLRKGGTYRIHVVNVNAKDKNISFVLDAFSEQHNTLFGQTRSFKLTPKVEGTFSYQCPETAEQGRLVIFSDERKPASE